MSQSLYADGDTIRTNIAAGTWANIDEEPPNDSDFVRTTPGASAVYEVSLTNPAGLPNGTSGLAVFRAFKCDSSGTPKSDGQTVEMSFKVYQGGTLIHSGSGSITLNSGVAQSGSNANLSSVTNWNDLRLRLIVSVSGAGSNRCAAITYARVDVPDPANYSLSVNSAAFAVTAASVDFDFALPIDTVPYDLSFGAVAFNGDAAISVEELAYEVTAAEVGASYAVAPLEILAAVYRLDFGSPILTVYNKTYRFWGHRSPARSPVHNRTAYSRR